MTEVGRVQEVMYLGLDNMYYLGGGTGTHDRTVVGVTLRGDGQGQVGVMG